MLLLGVGDLVHIFSGLLRKFLNSKQFDPIALANWLEVTIQEQSFHLFIDLIQLLSEDVLDDLDLLDRVKILCWKPDHFPKDSFKDCVYLLGMISKDRYEFVYVLPLQNHICLLFLLVVVVHLKAIDLFDNHEKIF